jgi:hypothetical protein
MKSPFFCANKQRIVLSQEISFRSEGLPTVVAKRFVIVCLFGSTNSSEMWADKKIRIWTANMTVVERHGN